MPGHSVQRTSQTSAFGEIGKAFTGACAGFLIFCLAFPVLWGNERRQAKMWELFGQAQQIIKPNVPSDSVSGDNEACLVHVQGCSTTQQQLKDSMFGIAVRDSVKLRRTVLMYQWKENAQTEERDTMMGGKEKVTTYTYTQEWSPTEINSSQFNQPGYNNPPFPFQGEEQVAKAVSLGSFQLTERLIGMLSNFQDLSESELSGSRQGFCLRNGVYTSEVPGASSIGDVRVSFQKVVCGDATVLAVQRGRSFGPFTYGMAVEGGRVKAGGKEPLLGKAPQEDLSLESGSVGCCALCGLVASAVETNEEIYGISEGKESAGDMLRQAAAFQQKLHYILQIVGFFMLFLGLYLMFNIIPALFRIIPLIGTWIQLFGKFVVGLASFFLASFLWCITVALAWMSMRPLKGLLLLIAAGALFTIPTLLASQQATVVPM